MASPITPSIGRALSIIPGARVLQKSPLTDETIWKRLKESGFDEESIKRRDKAALIAYIAKLEAEIYDLQHNMGLLILERKELASNYDQIKASAEAVELAHKREVATHSAALAEAKRREDVLIKALGVEKECIASIEKALHEMRAECAETKVSSESKLAEACNMMDDAQKKFVDAEAKLYAAESLQAEATRYHRAAERKLQEVEAHEGDLIRRISSFKADCDSKEKEIILERQSLSERRKVLHQEHERLLERQVLLNQREDYIAAKSQELTRQEKELDASKANIEKELRVLNDEKSNLQLALASLSGREEAVIQREALLNKREQDILVLQEKMASKELLEIQKVTANQENILRTRKSEFEAELEKNKKLVEDETETKRRAWELREIDLSQREDLLREREHELEVLSRSLKDKEKDVTEKTEFLDDKERSVSASEKEIEFREALLQQEKQEINRMKLDLQKSLDLLEDKKKQVDCAKEKLETMKTETNELSDLEMKLKEEVDILRSQKLELMAEEDRLQELKAKFESEWESIDEKREELRKEAEHVAEERLVVSRLVKDERDSLRLEREAMWERHKRDVESLNCEREEFMSKMVQERSEWFNKIQQEHANFLLGMDSQKGELESSVEKRREEVESYLRDKEKAFEIEKNNELKHISSLREQAAEELELVALEMKKLETERVEIHLDREQRDKEWAVLNKSIEDLKVQTQKLEKQRELIHSEREEICAQIEHLNRLKDLKLALDSVEVAKLQQSNIESSLQKFYSLRYPGQHTSVEGASLISHNKIDTANNEDGLHSLLVQKPDVASPATSSRFSWIKLCTDRMFKSSPEKPLISDQSLKLRANLDSTNGYSFGEPKVIFEVPPESEIAKGTRNMQADDRVNDIVTHLTSEQVIQDRRKRSVESLLLDDHADEFSDQRESNKKSRQQDLSEDGVNRSATSMQTSVPEDLHVTNGEARDTNVLIINEVVKISEVTYEMADVNFSNQEKLEHLLNSEEITNCKIVQDESNNGHGNLRSSEVEEMSKEEHFGNVQHGTKQSQPQEDSSQRDNLGSKEPDVAESDNNEAVTKNITKRTRSKQKL